MKKDKNLKNLSPDLNAYTMALNSNNIPINNGSVNSNKNAQPVIIDGKRYIPLNNIKKQQAEASSEKIEKKENKKGVQLSPIVVPVAFVPYSKKKKVEKQIDDDDIFYQDNRRRYNYSKEIERAKKQISLKNTMRSMWMLLLFVGFMIPTILGLCNVRTEHVKFFNLMYIFPNVTSSNLSIFTEYFIHCGALLLALIGFIDCFIGIFTGSYKKYWIITLMLVILYSVNFAYFCISNQIKPENIVSCWDYQMIIHMALTVLIYLVSLVFIKRPTTREVMEEMFE